MAEAWHFDAALMPQRLVYLQRRLRISVHFTKSNLEQGAVDTELLLGYGEMQRDCIIGGGRITQK